MCCSDQCFRVHVCTYHVSMTMSESCVGMHEMFVMRSSPAHHATCPCHVELPLCPHTCVHATSATSKNQYIRVQAGAPSAHTAGRRRLAHASGLRQAGHIFLSLGCSYTSPRVLATPAGASLHRLGEGRGVPPRVEAEHGRPRGAVPACGPRELAARGTRHEM